MSHPSAKPSPAAAASATSPISAKSIANTLRYFFRPIVRLALKAGLKHADLDQALRDALFAEARAQLDPVSKSNASRLSLMTGLHRKEVGVRLASSELAQKDEASSQHLSLASRVLFRWAHMVRRDEKSRRLRLNAQGVRTKSFARLTKDIVSDVHFRSVLDELIRLGFVEETDGEVHLLVTDFTPKRSGDDRLALFAQNAHAMLSTGVENVLGVREPQLEYSIAMKNVTQEDAQRLGALARGHWKRTYDVLYAAIVATPEVSPDSGAAHVFRAGVYVNFEPQNLP